MPTSTGAERSALVAHYLTEQRTTAVASFSLAHDALEADGPPATGRYSALMPATPPTAGQQYAFDVDLDACSGCKSCVAACHALNGLEDEESWRDVGLLSGGTQLLPVLQHVTTACHHCLDPACLHGCPVDAYEKDPVTGIVRHLDDQCFGCQYCTLTCPYDAPKYSLAKGIVRKCDMCSDRLAVGEAPACVQSCPNGAIAIRVVETEQVVEESETNTFVPGAPEPWVTLPTTTYRTTRSLPRNMIPADYYAVHPKPAHWSLILMLVLTQMSVGAFLVEQALRALPATPALASFRPWHSLSALTFGLTALAVSVLHLGRPLYAFRAVIGLRHSWLSREIVAFGLFAMLAVTYALWPWLGLPLGLRVSTPPRWLGWSVALAGVAGVLCSVMVYRCTQRDFWNGPATGCKFFLTTTVLGIAAAWLSLLVTTTGEASTASHDPVLRYGPILGQSLIVACVAKLAIEAGIFRHLASRPITSLKRTALLMTGALSHVTVARFAAGTLGGIAMPGFFLISDFATGVATGDEIALTVVITMLFVACLAGEIMERYLFFTALASPRMPGGL